MALTSQFTGQDWIDLTTDLGEIKTDLEALRQRLVTMMDSDIRFVSRELSLTITKLDEGIMWLDRKLQEAEQHKGEAIGKKR